jgi:hypothetical protein
MVANLRNGGVRAVRLLHADLRDIGRGLDEYARHL